MDRTVGGRVPGAGLKAERPVNVKRRGQAGEAGRKVRNTGELSHLGTLFAVQMTPLTFPRQKDAPASGSVYHVDSNS